ncbi:MAG TPA: TRL-like family protein [Nitrospira sp.]|nr:TRL-like family protein [Nitrospira sp.]
MRQAYVLLSVAFIAVIGVTLAGCMPVASPVVGIIYTEAKYGMFATNASAATKEGKACAQTILGWVATGDASVSAAKAAGGITTVAHIDHTAKNVLGIIGEWCTIVKGS